MVLGGFLGCGVLCGFFSCVIGEFWVPSCATGVFVVFGVVSEFGVVPLVLGCLAVFWIRMVAD